MLEAEARVVARWGVLMIDIELGYEMRFQMTLKLYRDEQFLRDVGMHPYNRRTVAEGTQLICMVIGEVAGLKSGELVMAGILGEDCRVKTADRLLRSYR